MNTCAIPINIVILIKSADDFRIAIAFSFSRAIATVACARLVQRYDRPVCQ